MEKGQTGEGEEGREQGKEGRTQKNREKEEKQQEHYHVVKIHFLTLRALPSVSWSVAYKLCI